MIAAWMVWSVFVTALIGLAARAVEAILEFWRLPRRGIWLAAIAATATVSAAGLLELAARARDGSTVIGELWSRVTVGGSSTAAGGPVPVPSELAVALSPFSEAIGEAASGLPVSDTVLVAAWLGLVVAVAAVALIGSLRLWLVARSATPDRVDGVPVLRTDDVGPAVWGVVKPRVLWPGWAETLDDDARRTMLLHEREHVSARDPAVSRAGLAVAAVLAWNPLVWWHYRRLRRAVEIDCDRRVLARSVDRAAYGGLLLDVAERRTRRRPLLALIPPENQIEERIRAMIAQKPHHAGLRAAALGLVALGFGLVACETPVPVEVHDEASPQGRAVPDGSVRFDGTDGSFEIRSEEGQIASVRMSGDVQGMYEGEGTVTLTRDGSVSADRPPMMMSVTEEPPLIVVDGEVLRDVEGLSLESVGLTAGEVERVHVYRGAAAIERYGDEGARGVVEIVTK